MVLSRAGWAVSCHRRTPKHTEGTTLSGMGGFGIVVLSRAGWAVSGKLSAGCWERRGRPAGGSGGRGRDVVGRARSAGRWFRGAWP